jgi:hypothetical protein
MGMPRLPEVPRPVVMTDPDGLRHRMRYRVWRAPMGVAVELREEDVDEGFEFGVFGDHDADVAGLVGAVTERARSEIGRRYLEPGLGGAGWQLCGDEVAGRLAFEPDGAPPRVVVDGRELSWDELGYALGAFEGWRFRLVAEDRLVDVRRPPVELDDDEDEDEHFEL